MVQNKILSNYYVLEFLIDSWTVLQYEGLRKAWIYGDEQFHTPTVFIYSTTNMIFVEIHNKQGLMCDSKSSYNEIQKGLIILLFGHFREFFLRLCTCWKAVTLIC
jgi:hypothetical protein